jgi:hypothetical protein
LRFVAAGQKIFVLPQTSANKRKWQEKICGSFAVRTIECEWMEHSQKHHGGMDDQRKTVKHRGSRWSGRGESQVTGSKGEGRPQGERMAVHG